MKIQFLSNFELLGRFGKLVRTERKITHLVLDCIAEIDSRRLYLDKAYPSIYEFLVEEFGYSSSAALRRIESARLLRDVPELAKKIESGAINLSQLSKVQQAVRAVQKLEDRKVDIAEKMELLSRIEYTTQQQTEVILCQALSLPVLVEDKQRMHRDESVTLTITFSKEQMDLLTKVQDLIAHAVPEKKWSEVMTYLAQKEIQRRTHVRPNKNSSDKHTARSPLLKESKIGEVAALDQKPCKPGFAALSLRTKKIILNKNRYCQYRDPLSDKVCGGTRFLQIDHRHSVWAGGSNDIQNLQILCAEHNRNKYRKESGIALSSHPQRV
ncbi:MAG TPA: HNH endonuclease signature motif containing protein [Bdellovibrio sp.]